MEKTTLQFIRSELLAKGIYHTPDSHRAPVRHKPCGWVTFWFSLVLARVFPMCAIWEALRQLTTERWAWFCSSAFTIAEHYGMTVTIEGFEDRRRYDGPVMYLCNHMSTYETVALMPIVMTYGPIAFVAKQSLAHLPALERAAQHMNMIPLGRKSPKEDLLKMYDEGGAKIREGMSMVIFPQGTRQEVFQRKHFSSIGAKLAEREGIPIVPVVVDSRCLPTRKRGIFKNVFKDFGPVDTSKDVRICAGPVIPCGKAREMNEAAFGWMADKLESWGLPVERN